MKKRIGLFLLMAIFIGVCAQAKNIRVIISLLIDDDIPESRVVSIFRDYMDSIDDVDAILGYGNHDPSEAISDPETDALIHVTVVDAGTYVVVMTPSTRGYINVFLNTAHLPDWEEVLRLYFFTSGSSFAMNPSLDTAIGYIVDYVDDFLSEYIRRHPGTY